MPLIILLYFLWLNIIRALLCPSSGARDYNVDYHIGRFVLGLLYVGGQVRVGQLVFILKLILVHFPTVLTERDLSFSYADDVCKQQFFFCGVTETITLSIISFNRVSTYISLVLNWNISICCFICMYHFRFPHVLQLRMDQGTITFPYMLKLWTQEGRGNGGIEEIA